MFRNSKKIKTEWSHDPKIQVTCQRITDSETGELIHYIQWNRTDLATGKPFITQNQEFTVISVGAEAYDKLINRIFGE